MFNDDDDDGGCDVTNHAHKTFGSNASIAVFVDILVVLWRLL